MSDVEIDSDDEISRQQQSIDKRAHHNALERKRRDHIKESFCGLRDAIPRMPGDKSSRAQILKKASEYICHMREKNQDHQRDIDEIKRQNNHLEAKIRALEEAKRSGRFISAQEVLEENGLNYDIGPSDQSPDSISNTVVITNGDEPMVSDQFVQPQNQQPQVIHVQSQRSIQPGQSLLIAHSSVDEKMRKF